MWVGGTGTRERLLLFPGGNSFGLGGYGMAARHLYGVAYIGRYYNELRICVILNEKIVLLLSSLCECYITCWARQTQLLTQS